MGFEIFSPMHKSEISKGQCTLAKPGTLRVCRADLREIGVTGGGIVVIFDSSTRRLAVRKPRDGEPTATIKSAKLADTASITVCGALGRLGCDIEKVKGNYSVARKDDMLIVQLGK